MEVRRSTRNLLPQARRVLQTTRGPFRTRCLAERVPARTPTAVLLQQRASWPRWIRHWEGVRHLGKRGGSGSEVIHRRQTGERRMTVGSPTRVRLPWTRRHWRSHSAQFAPNAGGRKSVRERWPRLMWALPLKRVLQTTKKIMLKWWGCKFKSTIATEVVFWDKISKTTRLCPLFPRI